MIEADGICARWEFTLTGNKNNRNCTKDSFSASPKCFFSSSDYNNCRFLPLLFLIKYDRRLYVESTHEDDHIL